MNERFCYLFILRQALFEPERRGRQASEPKAGSTKKLAVWWLVSTSFEEM